MKPRTLVICLLVLLAVVAAGLYRLMPQRLVQVPDISLMSVAGEELRLPDYRGRPLLVTFWSTSCSSCVAEIPHLSALYRELAPRGLEIIGIAMAHDPPNQVLGMRKSRGMPYPVTLDIHADAARAFGNISVTPTSFLFGPDGRVAQHRVGRLDMAGLRREILAMIAAQTDSATNPGLPDTR
jgi:peroxiredoxin